MTQQNPFQGPGAKQCRYGLLFMIGGFALLLIFAAAMRFIFPELAKDGFANGSIALLVPILTLTLGGFVTFRMGLSKNKKALLETDSDEKK